MLVQKQAQSALLQVASASFEYREISERIVRRGLIEPNGPPRQVQEKTFKKRKRQWALKYFRDAVTDVVTAL
jgi:hypothetical protein